MKIILIVLFAAFLATPATATQQLRIGLLLIEDSIPFWVAEQEEYYQAHNVDVQLIPFLSALERDSALAAGAIDGAISDPIGAILFDQGTGRLKITSLGLGKTPAEGVFAILASPKSDITTVEQLKGVEIAVSNSTIIEYVTDKLLQSQGFSPDNYNKIEVKKMPIRMQMLLSNSVSAATLPEPLASIAVAKGAKILLKDSNAEQSLSQTVIIFRSEVLDKKKIAVQKFFRAYGDAVNSINTSPEKFRALFLEKGRIPAFMADSYPIPVYPQPEPFSVELYQPVIQWLVTKGLVNEIAYAKMVSQDFMSVQSHDD
ncbi:NitT/TauT family transport system substrate-binding protein [Desulfuromusa kysingii]|uniref:NitT/TauT family transport system substrate-binding protein n=1 Tax=Desulfuromusa kysingii TaxID=37625 RepID=A0A1H3XMR4_9BACT|nr:MetQ/NlpA family ABC transporter substrate-binding protein [Desulfuromusa kysingii]SEA00636.1 NitT/TauT family transport system substrate-binding protein [Desulfuromusa kysingii]